MIGGRSSFFFLFWVCVVCFSILNYFRPSNPVTASYTSCKLYIVVESCLGFQSSWLKQGLIDSASVQFDLMRCPISVSVVLYFGESASRCKTEPPYGRIYTSPLLRLNCVGRYSELQHTILRFDLLTRYMNFILVIASFWYLPLLYYRWPTPQRSAPKHRGSLLWATDPCTVPTPACSAVCTRKMTL